MAIENLNEIEKSLGLEEGKLSEMISSEENHTVDLSGKVILSQEDFETRISNERKEASKAGVEIAIKNARNELGLDFQGKTMENLLGAYKANIEGGFNTDASEREKALKADLEAVQGNFSSLQSEFDTYKSDITKQAEQRKLDSLIMSNMPDNLSISKEDALLIFKNKHNIQTVEGGELQISDLNGQVYQDENTRSNLSLNSVLAVFAEPYKAAEQSKKKGRAEANQHKQFSADSLEAFNAEMNEKGISGEQYNLEMNKRIQSGTLKF